MLREKIVFGPIKSRRLGNSLGINLLPENGKICNFDCIYCECGWNRDGRGDKVIPNADKVRSVLEEKLLQIVKEGTAVDSITFSGDGEPTLNPDFAGIVSDTLLLRDTYCPGAKVSVLTNATRLGDSTVVEALKKVDNPILKLDAPTSELARVINKALPDYKVEDVVKGMKLFDGGFILQTMFLKGPDFDSLSPDVLNGWMDIVRDVRPRLIMAYTIARPTPMQGLLPYGGKEIKEALAPLEKEGFRIQINA